MIFKTERLSLDPQGCKRRRAGPRIQHADDGPLSAVLCGDKHPKRLAERVHTCPQGTVAMPRDVFSAYLARFVEDDALPIAAACASWPGAKPDADGLGAGNDKPTCEGTGSPVRLWPATCRLESERVVRERMLARN